jgi:hypothetical protein
MFDYSIFVEKRLQPKKENTLQKWLPVIFYSLFESPDVNGG